MHALAWFALGIFIGTSFGFLLAALVRASRDLFQQRHPPRQREGEHTGEQQVHGEVVIVHHPARI
jgi:hypothetical protein